MKRWLGVPACQNQVMDTFGHSTRWQNKKFFGHGTRWQNKKAEHNSQYCVWIWFGSCLGICTWKTISFLGFSEWSADIFTPNYSGNKNIFLDVAVIFPGQHKYVVDAAQTLGFSCNYYANEVSKTSKQEFVKTMPYIFQQFLNLLGDSQETFQYHNVVPNYEKVLV